MLRAIIFLALPLLAFASPLTARDSSSTGSDHPGSIQCCKDSDMVSPYSEAGAKMLKDSNLESHSKAYIGMIAASCNTGIGALDGPTCADSPIACDASYGLISIGCLPIVL